MKNVWLILVIGVLFLSSCKEDEIPVVTGDFRVTIENVFEGKDYLKSGEINPGGLAPGNAFEFSFEAGLGTYLSFATMFVQSNDLFYAPAPEGISLYPGGTPLTGDITNQVDLWDAGTEVNEEPGVGVNQAPRQSGPDTGVEENGNVLLIDDVADGYTYPSDESVLEVTIVHDGATGFTVTIRNISDGSSLPTPLAPGVYVIHESGTPLFVENQPSANGLEPLAEDGGNGGLLTFLDDRSGFFSPFAPGVWAIHPQGTAPLFSDGAPDFGEGLEVLAEDGDPAELNGSLAVNTDVSSNGVFNTPDGAAGPGPLLPGQSYSFSFSATQGDYLSLATMLVQSNDLFAGFDDIGLSLFPNGVPISGNVTDQIDLWDVGTEVNEYPGAGANQPLRGGGNSGPAENGNVVIVDDGFTYPSVSEMVRITITVQ
ncbi:MAG: spondin domain-containing protein [Bacteroidota bacterium]